MKAVNLRHEHEESGVQELTDKRAWDYIGEPHEELWDL